MHLLLLKVMHLLFKTLINRFTEIKNKLLRLVFRLPQKDIFLLLKLYLSGRKKIANSGFFFSSKETHAVTIEILKPRFDLQERYQLKKFLASTGNYFFSSYEDKKSNKKPSFKASQIVNTIINQTEKEIKKLNYPP